MELSGATPMDRRVLRRALVRAPFDVFRDLGKWRDPTVDADCMVRARGVGSFFVRARSDDLWHALPTREPAVIAAIRRLLRPGDVFVDAGANIGIYSVLAARLVGPDGRVVAFEMMPDTAEILRTHLVDNNCDNAVVIEAALWSRSGDKVTAHVSDGKYGQASISTGSGNRTTEVETIALSEALSEFDRIALIKMDLEGAELEALKGAEPLLDRVAAILFEDWGGSEVSAYLAARGFVVRRLDGKNSLAVRA
ncbi:conserved hypothetical protein [Altererythrobacter sp. B11]|nr:conserved hypothetical protein [Altererythrobacter sp. B11]